MTLPKLTREICHRFIEEKLFEPRPLAMPNENDGTVGCIGIELEVFPYALDVESESGFKPVRLYGEGIALAQILARTSEQFGGIVKYSDPDPLHNDYVSQIEKIEFADGDCFLFEPGGQVEISTAPCTSMDALEAHLKSKQDILSVVTQKDHIHFDQFGTNPWFHAHEIGNQLHKPRYQALERYFDGISPYGKQMMLQTCALHINLDLGVEQTTRLKRIIAANLLVPFVTALFAHSGIIEGRVNGLKSYRSFLWQHLDPARTGILPLEKVSKSLSKKDLIDAYLEFALQAPVMYIKESGGRVYPKHYTLDYWMDHSIDGIWPTTSHLENHISLLFPEVRLKGYLEVRSVDAPPPEWQMVPVFFYAGLLYADEYLDKTLEMLLPLTSRTNALFADATYGLASDEIFSISKNLMRLAIDGFSSLPDEFRSEQHTNHLIAFFERFTLHRKTFADETLEKFMQGQNKDF